MDFKLQRVFLEYTAKPILIEGLVKIIPLSKGKFLHIENNRQSYICRAKLSLCKIEYIWHVSFWEPLKTVNVICM